MQARKEIRTAHTPSKRSNNAVTPFIFGRTKAGDLVTAYCLNNTSGATATILDYGCTVQSLCVPNLHGALTDVVLGYDTVTEYEENSGYVGAAIGRVANRIGRGEFTLNEKTYKLARNDGKNHLHGGLKGFDKVIWNAQAQENKLILTRLSPDGEEGYPGNLAVRITYTLTDHNALQITYDADTDADTIVSLTNHSYFNLNGKGSVLRHYLQVAADQFTENDASSLPTGKLLAVAETPFDFIQPKQIGQDIDASDTQLLYGDGYDHNFIVSRMPTMKKAAALYSHESGISMTLFTTQPGLQVYSSNKLTPRKGKNGSLMDRHDAICLETQAYPNAISHKHFPSPILRTPAHYHEETLYRFENTSKEDT